MKTTLLTIILTLVVILLVIATILSAFDKFTGTVYDALKEECERNGGHLLFYECQNIPFATPCSELKTGYWCELPNGTSYQYRLEVLN